MNRRARIILAAYFVCAYGILPALLLSGCASPRSGRPVHALLSIDVQLGGSDTTIYVSEEQYGAGNEITKDFPFKASVSDPTDIKVVP